MEQNLLTIILIVLFSALLVTLFFKQFKLPVILGYLLVGAIMGPHTLGLVPDSPYITSLAEFGIVFLMFTIGLEFSLNKLIALRQVVFYIGGLQVLLTLLFAIGLNFFFESNFLIALTIGSIVAMSSTALVVKHLKEELELHTTYGLNSIGILLFQDLAVIPLIILIASLSRGSTSSLPSLLMWATIKALIAIGLIFLWGKILLTPLFRVTAKTRAMELFTLMVLLVALFAAWATHILGLSYALGAFLAGIMLGETQYRHQIEAEIRPFRDILLGLFFISIGLLANIPAWPAQALWIMLLLAAIVVGKMILVFCICRLFGNSFNTSLRTGILLAQAGEFSFAILTLALQKDILSVTTNQIILAALLLSMAISPLLLTFNKQIARFFSTTKRKSPSKEKMVARDSGLKQHIVICGYGRVGQHIAQLLDRIEYPYIAIELDTDLVHRAKSAGENIIFGDPAQPDILKAANLGAAKALVISFNDIAAAKNIIGIVKQYYGRLPILVRCRDENELKQLQEYDSTQVVAELYEASLSLSEILLNVVAVPAKQINEILSEVRNKDYDLLSKVFTSEVTQAENKQLLPIIITNEAYAVDKKILDLNLKAHNVEIIALRRGDAKYFKPAGNIKLNAQDILIVFGLANDIETAEKLILEGV